LEDCSKEEQREKSFTTEDTEGTEKKGRTGKDFTQRGRRGDAEGAEKANTSRRRGKKAKAPASLPSSGKQKAAATNASGQRDWAER
jgi:hypothetical protein